MKTLLCGFAAVLFMLPGCASAGNAKSQLQKEYLYCNVYPGVVCFGIAAGDLLEMTIPVDFVLYRVKIRAGLAAVIYSGYNPRLKSADLKAKFENCVDLDSSCAFMERSDEVIEAVYSPDRKAEVVHVLLEGVNSRNEARALDFMANFRKCSRSGHAIKCEGGVWREVVTQPIAWVPHKPLSRNSK